MCVCVRINIVLATKIGYFRTARDMVNSNDISPVDMQIARYLPILNQSTGLSNEGFTWAFTHRITGSLALLFQTNGSL